MRNVLLKLQLGGNHYEQGRQSKAEINQGSSDSFIIRSVNSTPFFIGCSTYDVVYANDTLRSIFSAALEDLYEKYKSICNQDATDSIIAPLVEKYGDKSNGGMVTYRKVYKKMGEMSPINWHNLEVRYINKHGKAGARRKKIISSNPEMLRKFKNAVDVMMVG